MVSSELMYMKTANMQKGDKICMAWICNCLLYTSDAADEL